MVPMDSESDSSMASGSDSSNSSEKRLPNSSPSCPATFYLSSAYEEGSTVKECGRHWPDGHCKRRIWKKLDLALGACEKCGAAECEGLRLQKERQLEQLKKNFEDIRKRRRQLEARLRRQFDVAWSAARWKELLAGESPSGSEKESGRSFVVSRRDIAELDRPLDGNETDGISVAERRDDRMIQILGTFGLQVA